MTGAGTGIEEAMLKGRGIRNKYFLGNLHGMHQARPQSPVICPKTPWEGRINVHTLPLPGKMTCRRKRIRTIKGITGITSLWGLI